MFSGSTENTALDLPADVSVDSNSSSLNVTVVAANEEKPLPPRETGQANQKVLFAGRMTFGNGTPYSYNFHFLG